jgi:hypothetical protein
METNSVITRRDMLKRGAVAGTAVLWAVPVVQVIGMSASHAEAASGGGGGSTTPPPGTPTEHPTPPTNVLPTEFTQTPTPTPSPTPTVQGIEFQQPPPPAVNPPTATLPFTGAAVPVTGAVALGAGLVATGVAAVAATRRRQEAVATDGAQPPAPESPAV